ncbi:MAG: anti-sigma factor domain-containing protein, partial [Bacillota bacterium]|nr:anti-sigma factor domain-containing protein [Bacillota bacterium]
MKKTGLVTQINKKYACIMTPSGEFSKVRYKAQIPALGEVYSGEVYSAPRLKLPLAAASLAFLLFSGGLYSYMSPAYAVTVDINPAVKLQINMWNRIIGTEAVNEDGKKLLSGINLKNMSVNGALEAIVSEAKKDNYIDENNTTQASEVRVIVEGKKDAPAALKHFSDYVKNKN